MKKVNLFSVVSIYALVMLSTNVFGQTEDLTGGDTPLGGTNNAVVITQDSIKNSACSQSTGGVYISVSGNTTGVTYAWQTAAGVSKGGAQDLVAVAHGLYNLYVGNASGCQDSLKSVSVSDQNGPVLAAVSLFAGNDTVCSGTQITLQSAITTPGTLPYQSDSWYNGATNLAVSGNQAVLSITSSGTYVRTIVDANGCSANSLVGLDVVSLTAPHATLSLNDTTVCEGTQIIATGGGNVFGNGTIIVGSTSYSGVTRTYAPNNGDQLRFVASNAACSDTTSVITVVVHTRPTVALVSTNPTYCSNLQYQFTGTNANWNYQIRNGSTILSDQPGNGGVLTTPAITQSINNRAVVIDKTTGCAIRK